MHIELRQFEDSRGGFHSEGCMHTLRYMALAINLLVAGIVAQPVYAGPAEDVHARFEEWVKTFNSHDPDRLSQLYDQDARLLSTGGNEKPLDGRETIRVYFIPFTMRGDMVTFDHDGEGIRQYSRRNRILSLQHLP
jgi:hypothetical protein